MHTCRSGLEDSEGNSLAKLFSEGDAFKEHTIIAPDKYHVMISENESLKNIGIYGKNTDDAPVFEDIGKWNIYKGGAKIGTILGNEKLPTIKKEIGSINLDKSFLPVSSSLEIDNLIPRKNE